jgi:hypothetical protein
MKSFLKFAAKIPDNYLPRIEQSITRAVEVLSDPNASSDAYEAVAKELADIQHTVGKGAANAWKGEVAERLKADWIQAGRDGIAMERQVAPNLTRILESSEKLRAVMQSSYVKAVVAKLALGVGAATVLIAAVAGVGMSPAKVDSTSAPSVTRSVEAQPAGPPPKTAEENTAPEPATEPEPPPEDSAPVPIGMGHDRLTQELIAGANKLAELKALPPQPVAVQPLPRPPEAAVLRPQVIPASPPPSGFNPPVLPDLKTFSVTACRAPDEAAIVYLYSPAYNFAYKDQDDRLANSLATGMGECQRRLFYQLIAMIREGQYWKVDRQWIRNAVAPYHPELNTAPPSSSKGGGKPPKNTDAGCFMQSNPFGPDYRVCPVN